MKKFVFIALLPTALFAIDLLIAHCDPGATSDVETYIAGDFAYEIVVLVDCRTYTPTVAEMLAFDCVLTWSNYAYADPTAMGDNLADYVDAGGRAVLCDFALDETWGLRGRVMTDRSYCPFNTGSSAYFYTSLGDDSGHDIMDGVDSITDIYYWCFVGFRTEHTWIADNLAGYRLAAINYNEDVVGLNMYPGDYRRWAGDGWTLFNNAIKYTVAAPDHRPPPEVTDMDPGHGEEGVPTNTNIRFRCVDWLDCVETGTIEFSCLDTSRIPNDRSAVGARFTGVNGLSPSGEISGELRIDDTDPGNVVCTFTPDEELPPNRTIVCNVEQGLADLLGNATSIDFIWTFRTGSGPGVAETTWGAIKAAHY
jgi:hypothetical protein